MKIEPLHFTYTIEHICKNLNITFSSDIIEMLYNTYLFSYENYTLLELIYMCFENNIKIDCLWNKKEIISMIIKNNLKIPLKNTEMMLTKYICYTTLIHEKFNNFNTKRGFDIIDTNYMQFYEGCIIQFEDGKKYKIYNVEYIDTIAYVNLENMDDTLYICIRVEDFLRKLDYDDVTIIQNMGCSLFLNEKEKIIWENKDIYIMK